MSLLSFLSRFFVLVSLFFSFLALGSNDVPCSFKEAVDENTEGCFLTPCEGSSSPCINLFPNVLLENDTEEPLITNLLTDSNNSIDIPLESCMRDQKGWFITEEDGYLQAIRDNCEKTKEKAKKCCSNPNACGGLVGDLVFNALPGFTQVYSVYRNYKSMGDVNSGKLTHQQAIEKMCNVNNKMAMGGYMSSLFQQISSRYQATCYKKIQKCEQTCNSVISRFKEDFKACYKGLFANLGEEDKIINQIIKVIVNDSSEDSSITSKAKYDEASKNKASKGIDAENLTNEINMATNKLNKKITDINEVTGCNSSVNEPISESASQPTKPPCLKLTEDIKPLVALEKVKEIFLYVDAYSRTVIDEEIKKDDDGSSSDKKLVLLRDSSNEKQIVNCSHIPDRKLTERNKPGAPVSPPMVQRCEQMLDRAFGGEKTTQGPPSFGSVVPGGTTRGMGSLAGNIDKNKNNNFFKSDVPLGISDDDDYGGIDDSPNPSNRPPLGSAAGFKSSGSAGAGGGGGGGVPSGSGALAGNSGPSGKSSGVPYASYGRGPIGGRGGFSESGTGAIAPAITDRALASVGGPHKNSKKGKKTAKAKTLKLKMMAKNQNSIFQIASKRIQQFCSDNSCNK